MQNLASFHRKDTAHHRGYQHILWWGHDRCPTSRVHTEYTSPPGYMAPSAMCGTDATNLEPVNNQEIIDDHTPIR